MGSLQDLNAIVQLSLIAATESKSAADKKMREQRTIYDTVYRCSFVLIHPRGLYSDLRVGEFPSLEHALQLAEVITQELSIDPEHRWSGWTLEVRDILSQVLITIRIPETALTQ
jgi:hypothetical protein